MPVRERGQGEPTPGQHVPFSGHVQSHAPGERRAFAPAATEDTGERDSPPEGSGFEPSVPLPRLSSIRAVCAEIIGRSTDSFGQAPGRATDARVAPALRQLPLSAAEL